MMLRCTTKTLLYQFMLSGIQQNKLSPFNMRDLRSPPARSKLNSTSCPPYKTNSSFYFHFQLPTLQECARNSQNQIEQHDMVSLLFSWLPIISTQEDSLNYQNKASSYLCFSQKDLNDQIMLRVACSPSTKPLEIVRNATLFSSLRQLDISHVLKM